MSYSIPELEKMILAVQAMKKAAFVPAGGGAPPPAAAPPPGDPAAGGGAPPVDPATGMPVDPATGMPMDPAMAAQMQGAALPAPVAPPPLPPEVEQTLAQITNSMDEVVGFVENLNMAYQKQQQANEATMQQLAQLQARFEMLEKSMQQPAGFM